MARSTMATLITRLRLAIGDPVGGAQTFTDDDLQDFLDNHRVQVRTVDLIGVRSVAAGGAVSYLEWTAPRGFWEADAVLQGNSYATLVPSVSDLVNGRWSFAASQVGPVYITGQTYDLYGAAVESLLAMEAKVADEFDFAADGQSFSRSQKAVGIAALITEYARRSSPSGSRVIEHSGAW